MKKKILLNIISLFLLGGAYVQDKPVTPLDTEELNKVYVAVQVKAEYPGGYALLHRDFKSRFHIPKEFILEEKRDFQIIVTFIVEHDGTLTDIKVARDPGNGAGDEAVRVLKEMPKWKPAIQNNRTVRSQFTLPLTISKEMPEYFFVGSADRIITPQYIGRAYWKAGEPDFIDHFKTAYNKHSKTKENKVFLIGFIVELDGTLSNIEVMDVSNNHFDQELADIVKQLGKWNPGNEDNKVIRSKYNLKVEINNK